MSQIAPQDHAPVNAPKRKTLTPKQRLELLLAFNGRCAKCGEKITDGEWDANHVVPLFQLAEGAEQEFEPLHKACHRALTDGKHAGENAKIRRLKIKHGPPEDRPKAQQIRSRGFSPRYPKDAS